MVGARQRILADEAAGVLDDVVVLLVPVTFSQHILNAKSFILNVYFRHLVSQFKVILCCF